LQVVSALDQSEILPSSNPNGDDNFDLGNFCVPQIERPWLTCLRNGDGNRGNSHPVTIALMIVFVRRHNQHCRGLAKVNPNWDDETLFQEARQVFEMTKLKLIFN